LALSQATAEERQILLTREREARAQAERMSKLRDEFLATLSHELRTPLNSILGWAQLLCLKTQDEATLKRGLETIERNARAQAELIDDLLDMSRIISGKISLEVQLVDPVDFVHAAMETIRPTAVAKNIQIKSLFDKNQGDIQGDPNRLQQVMWNLLSNAVKFTPPGGTIDITLQKRHGEVVIKVADSGIGINAEFLPYVFDRFRQADSSTTRKYGGLGLGLSIVKNLVELQGGTVHVASEGEGKGTAFTLRFPLHRRQISKWGQVFGHTESRQPVDTNFKPVDLSGIKVLVIDDEADTRDLVKQILTDCSAQTVSAANAKEAMMLVERERPDAIVSDIGMPDMDGFELMRRVRALGSARGGNTPAIALTAFTPPEDKTRLLQADFTYYMLKPVDPSELVANVATMVSHSPTLH